jgi:hypothetical protein
MSPSSPTPTPPTTNDDGVRAERARHVANVLASVRMEGVEPHPEVLSLCQRFIEGELALQELGSRIEAVFKA